MLKISQDAVRFKRDLWNILKLIKSEEQKSRVLEFSSYLQKLDTADEASFKLVDAQRNKLLTSSDDTQVQLLDELVARASNSELLDTLRKYLNNFSTLRAASTLKDKEKEHDVPLESPLLVKPLPMDDELKFLDSPSPQPPISSSNYSIARYVQDRRLGIYKARKKLNMKKAEEKLNQSLAQADVIIQNVGPENLARSKSDGQTLLSKSYIQRQKDKLRAKNVEMLQAALTTGLLNSNTADNISQSVKNNLARYSYKPTDLADENVGKDMEAIARATENLSSSLDFLPQNDEPLQRTRDSESDYIPPVAVPADPVDQESTHSSSQVAVPVVTFQDEIIINKKQQEPVKPEMKEYSISQEQKTDSHKSQYLSASKNVAKSKTLETENGEYAATVGTTLKASSQYLDNSAPAAENISSQHTSDYPTAAELLAVYAYSTIKEIEQQLSQNLPSSPPSNTIIINPSRLKYSKYLPNADVFDLYMSGRARTKSRGRSVQRHPFKLKSDLEAGQHYCELSISALKTSVYPLENKYPDLRKKPAKPVSRSYRSISQKYLASSISEKQALDQLSKKHDQTQHPQRPVKPTRLKLNPKKYALRQIMEYKPMDRLYHTEIETKVPEKSQADILSQKQLNLQRSKLELARMSRARPDLVEAASHKRSELKAAQHMFKATKQFRNTQIVNKQIEITGYMEYIKRHTGMQQRIRAIEQRIQEMNLTLYLMRTIRAEQKKKLLDIFYGQNICEDNWLEEITQGASKLEASYFSKLSAVY